MLRDPIDTLQPDSNAQDVTHSPVASLEEDGFWAYTPDGDVFVTNASPSSVHAHDSPRLTPAFIETCF